MNMLTATLAILLTTISGKCISAADASSDSKPPVNHWAEYWELFASKQPAKIELIVENPVVFGKRSKFFVENLKKNDLEVIGDGLQEILVRAPIKQENRNSDILSIGRFVIHYDNHKPIEIFVFKNFFSIADSELLVHNFSSPVLSRYFTDIYGAHSTMSFPKILSDQLSGVATINAANEMYDTKSSLVVKYNKKVNDYKQLFEFIDEDKSKNPNALDGPTHNK